MLVREDARLVWPRDGIVFGGPGCEVAAVVLLPSFQKQRRKKTATIPTAQRKMHPARSRSDRPAYLVIAFSVQLAGSRLLPSACPPAGGLIATRHGAVTYMHDTIASLPPRLYRRADHRGWRRTPCCGRLPVIRPLCERALSTDIAGTGCRPPSLTDGSGWLLESVEGRFRASEGGARPFSQFTHLECRTSSPLQASERTPAHLRLLPFVRTPHVLSLHLGMFGRPPFRVSAVIDPVVEGFTSCGS